MSSTTAIASNLGAAGDVEEKSVHPFASNLLAAHESNTTKTQQIVNFQYYRLQKRDWNMVSFWKQAEREVNSLSAEDDFLQSELPLVGVHKAMRFNGKEKRGDLSSSSSSSSSEAMTVEEKLNGLLASPEAVITAANAVELFILDLTLRAFHSKHSSSSSSSSRSSESSSSNALESLSSEVLVAPEVLHAQDIGRAIAETENFDFLADVCRHLPDRKRRREEPSKKEEEG